MSRAGIGFGSEVIWTRPGRGYPVRGIVHIFVNVHQNQGPVEAAVIVVTQDGGLYRAGGIALAALAELEAAAARPAGSPS